MRSFLPLVALLLLPACVDEPTGDGGGISLDSPAVERCEETVLCAMEECEAEVRAVAECFHDEWCSGEMDIVAMALDRERCIVDAGCWWGHCDPVAAYDDPSECILEGEGYAEDERTYRAIMSGLLNDVGECSGLTDPPT